MLKRAADGYCWSRGRPHKDAGGRRIENGETPCTAWINEALCKVIYVNLRRTTEFEISTGYTVNYLADTFFPRMPNDEKLVA